MSDSPEKSPEKCEEIDGEDVLSDKENQENQEPNKKRVKTEENSEAVEDSTLEKTIVKNLREVMQEILNASSKDLEERIRKIEIENSELKKQNAKLEAEQKELKQTYFFASNEISQLQVKISNLEFDCKTLEEGTSKSIKKSIHGLRKSTEQKIHEMEENLEKTLKIAEGLRDQLEEHKESQENSIGQLQDNILSLEEDMKALKISGEEQKQFNFDIYERLGQFQETTLPTLKSYEEGLRRLYEDQENTEKSIMEVKKGFFNLQADHEIKTKDLYRLIDECRELRTNHEVPMYQLTNSVIPSDNCQLQPTNAEIEYQYKCIFCNMSNHRSMSCRNVSQYSDRLQVLREQGRCTKCLELPSNHFSCQRARVMCSNCHWDPNTAVEKYHSHHPIVCPFNDRSQFVDARKLMENNRRICNGLPPRFT